METESWLNSNLICPRTHESLHFSDDCFISSSGMKYLIVKNTPIMLLDDVDNTLWVIEASIKRARGQLIDKRNPDLFLESLGITDKEINDLVELAKKQGCEIDPVISYLIGATNGRAYKHLRGMLKNYPIPEIPLPRAREARFLDIGCNWGRWCMAAEKLGYLPIGIDPSLGAIMAAKRVAKQQASSAEYVVADGRFLPFKNESFDVVFSYSVLQHMSLENVKKVLSEVSRVLKPGGKSLIQMPNKFGILCLYHQLERGFREPSGFDVRYWNLSDLKNEFSAVIGNSSIFIDCFFGLGLQKTDLQHMNFVAKCATYFSEFLKKIAKSFGFLIYFADSVYILSKKKSH